MKLQRLTDFFRKSWPVSSTDPGLLALFGALPTSAGVTVSPETALRIPAVSCAIRAIAEPIGQLPVKVFRRGPDGSKEPDPSHPAYTLLHDAPNDWQSAYDLRQQVQVDALLHGDGFAYVNRVRGQVTELIRLDPSTVTVDDDDGAPSYKVRASAGGERVIQRGDIIHVRALSTNGIRGRSPIADCREALAILLSMEQHEARLFGAGGRPSGVLEVPAKVGPGAAERIAASWTAAHGGTNSGRTAVLEQGATFKTIAFTSVDLQFLELKKQQIEEIARVFRVPPHLLFELGRATWGNAEEMGAAFLTYSLLPWIKQWEGQFRRCLFTEEERATYFAEFLVDDLARADIAARSEAYAKLIAARVLNPNEVRALENRPPYEGGDELVNPNVTTTTPAADAAGGTA